MIPNAFTQRGVLGGDSRSGSMPLSPPAVGYGSGSAVSRSSAGRAMTEAVLFPVEAWLRLRKGEQFG